MFEPELEVLEIKKLRSLQAEKMLCQIRYAYENVPFYKVKFEEMGITPDNIKSLEDVAKIPFTVKDELRDHYLYGILAVPLDRIVEFHSSSGTSGIPPVVSYTAKDVKTWSRLMARTFAAAGAGPDDIAQNAYGYGLFTGGLGFHYGAEELGCAVISSPGSRGLRAVISTPPASHSPPLPQLSQDQHPSRASDNKLQ